jgi:hypothetical protein
MLVVVPAAFVPTVWFPMVAELSNGLLPKAKAAAAAQSGLGGGVTVTTIGEGSTAPDDEPPITM